MHTDPADIAAPVPLDRERDRPHPLQIEGWRAMGSAGRTRLGIALRRQMRRLKLDALRTQHPEWPDARVRAELAKLFSRGRT
jgi:hypothetical protein